MGARLNIDIFKNIAKEMGGLCLSEIYINSRNKLKFQCANLHIWEAAANGIKNGQWCPKCGGSCPLTLEEMHKLALLKNGKCLSEEYINSKTKLKWQCANNHVWEAVPNNIKNGSWCPYCVNHVPLTIEEMYQIAKSLGGQCLSAEYINSTSKLKWKCSVGHIWSARPADVKKGHWCPYCVGKNKTIEFAHMIAFQNDGKCLSKEYKSNKEKLEWQCAEGHIWKAALSGIVSLKQWCPYCAKNIKLTIEEMQQIAQSRGGKCLSTEYFDNKIKLEWQCNNEHQFLCTPSQIRKGSWCPQCTKIYFNEEVCREYIKILFNNEFPSIKPEWLKNHETGQNLQLDGYCTQLNIAFEFNGQQHYGPVKFNDSITATQADINFVNQQKRDLLKIDLCQRLNIKLIIIPYWKVKCLQKWIIAECNRLDIELPQNADIDIEKIKQSIYIKKRK